MLDENRFRDLQRLIQRLAHPSFRRETGLAWIEGPRAFVRAVDHARGLHTVVVCDKLLQTVVAQMMVRRLRREGTSVVRVSPEQFRALSRTPRASGVGIIVHQHWSSLTEPACGDDCWVAVSQIRSAGNLGTIVRTAEAAGSAGLIVMDPRTDPFDPAVMRGSMGSVLSLPLTRATLPELIAWARRFGVGLVGTSPRGCDLYSAEIPPRSIVLLGEERGGLTYEELEACDFSVRIPMTARADSINVGVAAGVVLFELRRRMQLGNLPATR